MNKYNSPSVVSPSRPRALFALGRQEFLWIYGPDERRDIAALCDIPDQPFTRDMLRQNPSVLADVEYLFSGWGAPRLDEEFLKHAPKLQVVFYGAGSLATVATEAAWNRGIRFSSAAFANSIPVAEYSLAMIILGLKQIWHHALRTRELKTWSSPGAFPGCYRSVVGLVSLGTIARLLIKKLQNFDLPVIAYDKYATPEEARALGVELVSLPEIFSRADVISLHTPLLAETRGLINGKLMGGMQPNATLINTSRGAIINETELLQVARKRPDIQFILDVTDPEPPIPGSEIFNLPNIVLTPHIAGSQDRECARMGRLMIAEFQRHQRGEPLQFEITADLARNSIHRPVEA